MFWNDFHLDGLGLVYLTIVLSMTMLAIRDGRHSFHRQWFRFLASVMLLGAGVGLLIFSSGLQTLLLGWEVMGIASFLLVIFPKPLTGIPAKAFFIYRLGDVGLLLAMWASHHQWRDHPVLISLLLLVTASMQSSQLPFSSWLPQVLEKSTTASAILLTTLTAQMGTYLLLRTYPFWEHLIPVRVLLALTGLIAAAFATAFARAQSSVKRRIAYMSMAHTGLIFIEVAAGFKSLAIIHVAANAAWGAYRLLVQPSLTGAGVQESFCPDQKTWEDRLPKKLKYTLYMLYTKEWGVYAQLSKYLRF